MLCAIQNRVLFNIDDQNAQLISEAFSYFNGDWTPQVGMAVEMRSFLDIAATRKCFIDIGSLFGIFALAFTTYSDKVAYAIEPSDGPFQVLCRNIACNKERRIVPHKILFADSVGQLGGRMEWMHFVVDAAGELKAPATTLDEFCRQNNVRPDCLKIDTEGFEERVLRGGVNTISQCRPLIFLEAHRGMLGRYGNSAESLAQLLEQLRYDMFGLDLQPIPSFLGFMSQLAQQGQDICRVICQPRG